VFGVFSYWFMRYRRTWRGTVVISVGNPLLFLLGIGAGIGHLVDRHAPAQMSGVGYAAFFAPGLLAAAVMQTAFLEASRPVAEAAATGAYVAATPTPLEPEQMMAGHLLFVGFRVVTSSAAFVVIMAAFGLVDPWHGLAVVGAATLTGLAVAAPTAAWAVGIRQQRLINTVFRMVVMPLYMFSGTFFALSQLPAPVRVLVEALPLAQGVSACRALALGRGGTAELAGHLLYLAALAAGGIALARTGYRRRLHA
jgi:ABC-type polysaccharide/polyol phosphate export permease